MLQRDMSILLLRLSRGTNNIVLIWTNVVGPRPVVKIRAGRQVVEASVPQYGASEGQTEGTEKEKMSQHGW